MTIPKFDEKELTVLEELELPFRAEKLTPVYDFPFTGKEAVNLTYQGTAPWQILMGFGIEYGGFNPAISPDNTARAIATPGNGSMAHPAVGGKDMFGIEWEYVPVASGSMVKPGNPFISDASELMKKTIWPNINSWDWEGCRKDYDELFEGYVNRSVAISTTEVNGWFERLISFMDFEGALIAMIDEDKKPYVKEFFTKLSDIYIEIIKKKEEYFPEIDIYNFHDDWGSQQNSFFSPEVIEEMVVPFMKRVTDYIHSMGKYADLHSCGKIENMVSNMVAAGWDSWNPQPMNDTSKLYEEFGEKILIGVMPTSFDPDSANEDALRTIARDYAERFCSPNKASFMNTYAEVVFDGKPLLTRVFAEELYRQSRIRYSA